MPVIYIDVLLALNLFIDFLLLSAVQRILRLPSKRLRLVLGALIGSASSCLLFLPDLPPPLTVLIKIITAGLIIKTAFAWKSIIIYIKQLVVFLITSTVFAGIAFAIWFFAAPSGFYVLNGVVYYNVSPLVLTALTVVSYFAISLYDRFTHKQIVSGQDYRLILDCGKGLVGLRALYDTGHHATDVFSGSPVAIVRFGAIESYLPDNLLEAVSYALDHNGSPALPRDENDSSIAVAARMRLRLIPFQTVSGTGLLPAFCPQHMNVTGSRGGHADITGTYVAVCRILGRGEYDAIIGSDIVNLMEGSGLYCKKQ